MKISRLFEIVYLLLEKKHMTAAQLATHFEVSQRTILRDIESLTMAGVPIYTLQGKGGGISILDTFVLNKTTVSKEEQSQILMALQNLAPTGHIDTAKLTSKLGALFSETDTSWIEVDFSRWGASSLEKEKFELLKNAVIKKLAVRFSYSSSYGEITNRRVYPVKLVFKALAWHVQAYCLTRNSFRTFKLNRISELTVLTETFAGEDFTPPPIDTQQFSSAQLVHLKLLFPAELAYRVYDDFDINHVQRNGDGTFTVEIDWPNDTWMYSFLLSFGTKVTVLKPQNVIDTLCAEAKAIQEMYS